jgi:ABC-type transport system substrate-binding protein
MDTRLSRRGVLGIAAGIGAGSALTLAGCGDSSSDSADAAGAGGVGGTLKWGWDLPTSWDPIKSSAGWDVHVLSLVYASLTQEDAAGNAIPALASAWQYNAAGTEVTFTLRSGLKFSDGSALDAAAVAKSLNRSRPTRELAGRLAADLGLLGHRAGHRPVVLKLSEPNFQIPTLLAGKTGMIVSPTAFDRERRRASRSSRSAPGPSS